eukprot:m.75333 g.75333  ORF g.75333 m.75333 type:complete len:858 (-) comp12447_c2_seq2:148-2721(-)
MLLVVDLVVSHLTLAEAAVMLQDVVNADQSNGRFTRRGGTLLSAALQLQQRHIPDAEAPAIDVTGTLTACPQAMEALALALDLPPTGPISYQRFEPLLLDVLDDDGNWVGFPKLLSATLLGLCTAASTHKSQAEAAQAEKNLQASQYQTEATALHTRITSLEHQLERIDAQAESESSTASATIKQLREQLKTVEHKYNDAEKALTELRQAAGSQSGAQQRLAALLEERDSLEQDVVTLKEQFDTDLQQYRDTISKVSQDHKQSQHTVRELQSQLVELQQQLASQSALEETLREVQREKEQLALRNAALERKLAQLSAPGSRTSLSDELFASEKGLSLEDELAQSQAKPAATPAPAPTTQDKAEPAPPAVQDMGSNDHVVRELRQQLQRKAAELEAKERAMDMLHERLKELARCDHLIETQRQELEALETKLSSTQSEVARLSTALASASQQLNDSKQDVLRLAAENALLRQQVLDEQQRQQRAGAGGDRSALTSPPDSVQRAGSRHGASDDVSGGKDPDSAMANTLRALQDLVDQFSQRARDAELARSRAAPHHGGDLDPVTAALLDLRSAVEQLADEHEATRRMLHQARQQDSGPGISDAMRLKHLRQRNDELEAEKRKLDRAAKSLANRVKTVEAGLEVAADAAASYRDRSHVTVDVHREVLHHTASSTTGELELDHVVHERERHVFFKRGPVQAVLPSQLYPFQPHEDQVLIHSPHAANGNWDMVASLLPGRMDTELQARYAFLCGVERHVTSHRQQHGERLVQQRTGLRDQSQNPPTSAHYPEMKTQHGLLAQAYHPLDVGARSLKSRPSQRHYGARQHQQLPPTPPHPFASENGLDAALSHHLDRLARQSGL